MENKFEKLERIYVEYIINLIGPNEEIEYERCEKFKIVKKILTNSFITEDNIIPHIFCFGSFPMKTYLPDSDMDITIILEDSHTGNIITHYSYEFLNK
jgi:DNA polymerase sigma